jgi:hypothetical protein
MRKTIDFIGTLVNIIGLALIMWATLVYAPNATLTIFIWLIGLAVFGYIIFSMICSICGYIEMQQIKKYYKKNFFDKV